MQRRTRLTVAASGAAALLLALAGLDVVYAGSASASSSRCSAHDCAGEAEFVSYGEKLVVYDRKGDGHSAVVRYWLPGAGPFLVWASDGHGTHVKRDLNLPEGSWIFYQVCLGESGPKTIVHDSCGAGVTDYA